MLYLTTENPNNTFKQTRAKTLQSMLLFVGKELMMGTRGTQMKLIIVLQKHVLRCFILFIPQQFFSINYNFCFIDDRHIIILIVYCSLFDHFFAFVTIFNSSSLYSRIVGMIIAFGKMHQTQDNLLNTYMKSAMSHTSLFLSSSYPSLFILLAAMHFGPIEINRALASKSSCLVMLN